jgi:hypothetical protein
VIWVRGDLGVGIECRSRGISLKRRAGRMGLLWGIGRMRDNGVVEKRRSGIVCLGSSFFECYHWMTIDFIIYNGK